MGVGITVEVSVGEGGMAHPTDGVSDVAVAQRVGSGVGVGVGVSDGIGVGIGIGIGIGNGVGVGFGLEITGLFTTCQSFFFPT